MPKPRRCYVYSTEAQLIADIAAGIVSEHDADVLRAFSAGLDKVARRANKAEPEEPKP